MGSRGEKMQAEVLAVLQSSKEPLSAYDVIGSLRDSYPKLAPPTIYRALSTLVEAGKIHRLESLKAFVVCQCETHDGSSILSVCDDCGKVEENVAPSILKDLTGIIGGSGFVARRYIIEVHGLCASCVSEPVQA